MAVRVLPVAATQSPRAFAWSAVISASTRTASRSPLINVAEIGDHMRRSVPGGRSSVTVGTGGATYTSQVSCEVRFFIAGCSFSLLAGVEEVVLERRPGSGPLVHL